MELTQKEGRFKSFDDSELFYRWWVPQGEIKRHIVILHRGHEHSARVSHIPGELELENTAYYSFDMRGHGVSPGPRGWAPSFDTWVSDLNAFSVFLRIEHGVELEKTYVIANSVGSVMAVQWVHDYAPPIKGMILAAPAFSIRLYVPFALQSLRVVTWFTNKLFVNSYVKSRLLTRDAQQAKAYDADKLITKRIAISVLVSLFDSMKRLMLDAKAIETPTLILSAGSDYIVDNNVQKKFYERISSTQKKLIKLDGFKHALFHEIEREKVVQPIREFILEGDKVVKSNVPAVFPEAKEFSVKEMQELVQKPTLFKALGYAAMRFFLEKLGPLSNGMKIGLEQGFDSGGSLDYVYQNKARGKFIIGQVIDFFYLQSTGWRGIRQRKKNLKQTLMNAVQDIHARGQRPVVMDCAAGFGRYLFEVGKEAGFEIDFHLRDINPHNLTNCKRVSEEMGLKNCTFEQVDAFDEKNYMNLKFKPNIVIVSGLFELYSDNRMLFKTLMGVKSAMQPGGYILYTGQPWHPQLEIIARVLNNHKGTRWIMRTRVQAELDDLVKYVGFKKMDTAIDSLGIFTVSSARNV